MKAKIIQILRHWEHMRLWKGGRSHSCSSFLFLDAQAIDWHDFLFICLFLAPDLSPLCLLAISSLRIPWAASST
jgi:hypothetical protein